MDKRSGWNYEEFKFFLMLTEGSTFEDLIEDIGGYSWKNGVGRRIRIIEKCMVIKYQIIKLLVF